MRSLQGKLILLVASAAFALVYTILQRRPFAAEAALCFSYTVLFLGYAVRGRGIKSFFTGGSKPLPFVLLAHAICLVVVLSIFQLSNTVEPLLPYQFIQPLTVAHTGRPGPPLFRVVEMMCVTFLCWLELRWFRSQPADLARTRQWLWSLFEEKDQDLERMKGLRLR